MADIFLSYTRSDREKVAILADALKENGWSVWWDTALTAGQRFDNVIETTLGKAKAVIAVWSPESANSQWVKDEAGEGAAKGKLIPVIIDGAKPPLGFRQYQTVDLTGWAGQRDDPRLQDLIYGLKSLIEEGYIPPEWKPRRTPRPLSWYARGIGAGAGAIAAVLLVGYALFPNAVDRWLPWKQGFQIYDGFSVRDTGGEVLTGKNFQECQVECESRGERCNAFSHLASESACFLLPTYTYLAKDSRVRTGVRAILKQPDLTVIQK